MEQNFVDSHKTTVEIKPSTRAKYIVIEGPIGVGKSSLSHKLASTFSVPLLLEKPAENPFLERFYKSSSRYALPTQLTFLMQRATQLSALSHRDNNVKPGLIADFMLEKDPLFAKITLDDDEYNLYKQIFETIKIQVPKPDLVIFLQAPVNVLVQRIKKRRVNYEQGIGAAYLEKLNGAYTDYFHRYTDAPLLIVNAAQINPIENQSHYHALVQHIDRIDAGKHFFNPLVG